MEGSIFEIQGGAITLNKDAISLCPAVSKLTAKQIEYLILVYDPFDSPIWKKPLRDRQRLATRKLWGNTDEDMEKKIPPAAIKEIQAITYNSMAATIDMYRSKIDHLNEMMFSEMDVTRIGRITETLQKLQSILSDFEIQFSKSKEILILKGGKSLSFIEIKQRQAREFAKNQSHRINENGGKEI